MLHLQKFELVNYRWFESLELSFERDLTILFAENAGGKSALLQGLAMGLALLQPRTPKELQLNAERDVRRVRQRKESLSAVWDETDEDLPLADGRSLP